MDIDIRTLHATVLIFIGLLFTTLIVVNIFLIANGKEPIPFE